MTNVSGHRPVVVVGIDGSSNSAVALQWASEYARVTGAELRLVTAVRQSMGFGFAPVRSEQFELEARRTLEHTIQRVLGPTPSIDITSKVVRGNPATVLIDESRFADLIVVGDRGYEGFAGLLLGHVGEHCARHAHCSVIIVRGHER